MAKKKKEEIEIPAAVDLNVALRINVNTSTSYDYSPCAFGTDFINWKNYIEGTLEETKKNMVPKLGSIVTDREGLKYRFTDIRMDEVKRDGEVIPRYIFDLVNISTAKA